MAKSTDFQKRVIDSIISELQSWQSSNDIHSPSHGTSIEHDMFSNLEEYDFGEGPTDKVLAMISDRVRGVWAVVASLEECHIRKAQRENFKP
jgi:hypothetical protein